MLTKQRQQQSSMRERPKNTQKKKEKTPPLTSMLVRHPCMALVPNFTRAFPPSELSFSLTGCERYAPIILVVY